MNVWPILGSFGQQKVRKKSDFDLRTAFNLPIFDGKSFSQEQLSHFKCFFFLKMAQDSIYKARQV
jgi:hypothetical protein